MFRKQAPKRPHPLTTVKCLFRAAPRTRRCGYSESSSETGQWSLPMTSVSISASFSLSLSLSDMMKYSRLNYIGGKVNGQAYGAGTYFDRNGGVNTGYGSTTVVAVLNPKTAKTIDVTTLRSRARAFAASHPKFARAAGAFNTRFNNNNMSIYALAMGYNVITDSKTNPSYHNVIDRSALVYRKSDS